MVIRRFAIWGRLVPAVLAGLCLLAVAGCTPKARVSVTTTFSPAAPPERVYIVPFASTLVPEIISEEVFNGFVDNLISNRREAGVREFVILKDELKDIDPVWLAKQYYISGEMWSYIEQSGCCQTELKLKARAYLNEPGKTVPSVEIFLPLETFFDHDRSTVEKERARLARQTYLDLSGQMLRALGGGR